MNSLRNKITALLGFTSALIFIETDVSNNLFSPQVPVQRVTKYPLLLSRLLKVTPAHHEDRSALQESRERIEHALEHMNQVSKSREH
jgi:hypothetical protein